MLAVLEDARAPPAGLRLDEQRASLPVSALLRAMAVAHTETKLPAVRTSGIAGASAFHRRSVAASGRLEVQGDRACRPLRP